MKITLESEYNTVSINTDGSDLTVSEVIEKLFIPVMLAHQYQYKSLEKYIKTDDLGKLVAHND